MICVSKQPRSRQVLHDLDCTVSIDEICFAWCNLRRSLGWLIAGSMDEVIFLIWLFAGFGATSNLNSSNHSQDCPYPLHFCFFFLQTRANIHVEADQQNISWLFVKLHSLPWLVDLMGRRIKRFVPQGFWKHLFIKHVSAHCERCHRELVISTSGMSFSWRYSDYV